MVDCIAQVTLPYNTAIPTDVAVNTWSFDLASASEGNYDQVAAFMETFYFEVKAFLSPVISAGGANLKIYLRSDAQPRVPVHDVFLDIGADPAGDPLPEEVACCLSFRGVLASGSPPARRKGRIFLGPLSTAILDDDAQGRTRIGTASINAILDAYEAAWDSLTTAGNFHTVWSGASAEAFPIVHAWIDNAFDSQRRRGPAANFRQSRDAPFTDPA